MQKSPEQQTSTGAGVLILGALLIAGAIGGVFLFQNDTSQTTVSMNANPPSQSERVTTLANDIKPSPTEIKKEPELNPEPESDANDAK